MNKMITFLIGALIVGVLASSLAPSILNSFNTTNTTGWTTSQLALYGILGILFVAGLAVGFYKMFIGGK